MTELHLAVFLTLSVAFVIRIPSAFRSHHGRLSWLACGVGALAILTLGPVIPVATLDSALGGTNIIYLVQCWLALVAFWLLFEAARNIGGGDERPRRPWAILAYCGIIAIPFFLIEDRAPTALFFIHDHVDQLAAVICASIYMTGVALLSLRLLIFVRAKKSFGYWLFRAGGTLIIVGICVEIVALIWAHLGASSRVREALYAVFDPTFYSGAVLIVTGIIWFWGARLIRAHRTRTRIQRLERILTERAIALPATEDDHAYTVYALLIRITDATVLQKVHLTEEERTTVKESEEWIETILPQLVGASS